MDAAAFDPGVRVISGFSRLNYLQALLYSLGSGATLNLSETVPSLAAVSLGREVIPRTVEHPEGVCWTSDFLVQGRKLGVARQYCGRLGSGYGRPRYGHWWSVYRTKTGVRAG